jgi:porin
MKTRLQTIASLLAACAALLGGGSVAQAQSAASALTPTRAVDTPPVERLFGDWGGLQPTLAASGISLQVGAIAEVAGNVSGGTKQGATSANQLGVNLDINFERLSGIEGFSTHVILVNRSGSSDSVLFGDHLLPVQEIYGSGGNVGVHLVSAYGEETLLDGRFDITFGRMNVENDFASSGLYCNFTSNALCGDPKALPGGDIGHSAYPDAVWATRLKIRPTEQTYIKIGVYEVDQGLYSDKDRTGFEFNISQASGVYIPVEIAWEPKFGQAAELPGHYKLGVGYDSTPGYKDFSAELPPFAPGFSDRTHTGNLQGWGLFDQMLVRNGPGSDQGLIALLGFILNNQNHTAYAQQYYAGLVEKGFLQSRPQDAVSLLLLYVDISPNLISVEQIQQQLDVPLSNNATGIQSHEGLVELDYNIHVFRGVNFRPDFQYIIRPNAQSNIRNAPVLGFHTDVEF